MSRSLPGHAVRWSLLAAAVIALGGCVTPRLHSRAELASVAGRCEVPIEDLVQEPDSIRLLMLYTLAPSDPQIDCVHKWARKKRLHLAYIDAVERTER